MVYNDSHVVATLARNLVHHYASKHIKVLYNFVHECIEWGKLSLEKISSVDNLEDVMTKGLLANRFQVGFREVMARAVRTSLRSCNYFILKYCGLLLYLYPYEYGHYEGVSNVVSKSHVHTRRPIRPYL